MDPEKIIVWRAADLAFDQWLDQPEAERDAWLAAQDLPSPVREGLDRLIEAHLQPLPTLSALGGGLSGCRFGDWTLHEELGRGGMAVVYRAARNEGIAEQVAAVKVLTLGAMGAVGRARFRREAEILARLNHPNVTTLIDSGVSNDGTCWLAMPLVNGERIDAWCDRQALDARAIVRLHLQVCAAVAYAHSHLVIHRDIKPSNVMVDDTGHVHLLDFGIGQFADDNLARTQTFWRALTPGYSAPEQLAGARTSTAVDIYGAGALLHRLLTGRTPQGTNADADTTRPSVLVRQASDDFHRHYVPLKNDLDLVLQKALAESPDRRYATVDALADDLRRWLDGLPVLAQPPGLAYRARKFVTRNKGGVLAAGLLALTLAAGLGTTLWQADRAQKEAERARLQAVRADHQAARAKLEGNRAAEVRDFLGQIFASTDPSVGTMPTALDLLNEGARKARQEVMRDDPGAAAEILLLTGYARMHMSELDVATVDLLEAQKLFLRHRPEALYQIWRTHMHLASIYRVRGDAAAALREVRAAAAVNERRDDVDPDERVVTLTTLANALKMENPAGAERVYLQALQILERNGLRDTERHYEVVSGIVMARTLAGREDDESTRPYMAEVVRLAKLIYGKKDSGAYASLISGMALLYRRDPAKIREAEQMGRDAVTIAERVFTGPHSLKTGIYCNYGYQLLHQGNPKAALAHFQKGIANSQSLRLSELDLFACQRGHAYAQAAMGHSAAAIGELEVTRRLLAQLDHLDSKLHREVCGLQASLLLHDQGLAQARKALSRCPSPRNKNESLEWLQAQAEVALASDELPVARTHAETLRTAHAPTPSNRHWMRPWMLSMLLAKRAGDDTERSTLIASLGAHASAEPMAKCIAVTDPAHCQVIP